MKSLFRYFRAIAKATMNDNRDGRFSYALGNLKNGAGVMHPQYKTSNAVVRSPSSNHNQELVKQQ